MRKLILLSFAIFIASISNTFAYQSSTLRPSMGGYAGALVNVNAYCNYIGFQCYFDVSAGGSAVAYESGGTGTLIGEHIYNLYNSNTYSNTIYNYQYWGTIQMYMYGASTDYATLFWD